MAQRLRSAAIGSRKSTPPPRCGMPHDSRSSRVAASADDDVTDDDRLGFHAQSGRGAGLQRGRDQRLDRTEFLGGGRGVLLGAADGTYAPGINSSSGGYGRNMAVNDFDHDGYLDVAINHGSMIDIIHGHGDGSFGLPDVHYVGAYANDIETGDFNEDGYDDIVTASFSYGGTTELYVNDKLGGFLPAKNISIGPTGAQVEVGDVDGDHHLDLVQSDGYGVVAVLKGSGIGTFSSSKWVKLAASAQDLEVEDFNNDGYADLTITDGNTVSVFAGSAAATFQQTGTYTAAGATRLVVGDLNGDGTKDILSNSAVAILGRGDGGFYAPTSYGGATGSDISLGDLNGDGGLDAVAIAATAGTGVNYSLNGRNDRQLISTATQLRVSAPDTVVAGTAFDVTISALDAEGNVVSDFLGTIVLCARRWQDDLVHVHRRRCGGTYDDGCGDVVRGWNRLILRDDAVPSGRGRVGHGPSGPGGQIRCDGSDDDGGWTGGFGDGGRAGRLRKRRLELPGDRHGFEQRSQGSGLGKLHVHGGRCRAARGGFCAEDGGFPDDYGDRFHRCGCFGSLRSGDCHGGRGGQPDSVRRQCLRRLVQCDPGAGLGQLWQRRHGVHGRCASDGFRYDHHDIRGRGAGGRHGTFSVTPIHVGSQTLVATDVGNAGITGTSTINVTPGWGSRIVATPLTNAIAGQSQSTSLTIYDSLGNVSTVFTGYVAVTSSDPRAGVFYHYFSAADRGVKTIPVTLYTAGVQAVTILNPYNTAMTTTQAGISIAPRPLRTCPCRHSSRWWRARPSRSPWL